MWKSSQDKPLGLPCPVIVPLINSSGVLWKPTRPGSTAHGYEFKRRSPEECGSYGGDGGRPTEAAPELVQYEVEV